MKKNNKHGDQVLLPLRNTPFTSRHYESGPVMVELCHTHAQLPVRFHDTDVGADVMLIERCDGKTEDLQHDVTLFDTGLKIKPPEGYHVEVHAKSSLHKKGYMLANAVGIIDPDYRGSIKVALYKYNNGPDLELPCEAVQFVCRKTEYLYFGISDNPLNDITERGDGGFGSTAIKKGKEKEKTQALRGRNFNSGVNQNRGYDRDGGSYYS